MKNRTTAGRANADRGVAPLTTAQVLIATACDLPADVRPLASASPLLRMTAVDDSG